MRVGCWWGTCKELSDSALGFGASSTRQSGGRRALAQQGEQYELKQRVLLLFNIRTPERNVLTAQKCGV